MNFQGTALRGSHFTLGQTNQNSQFTSTMKMKFQPPSDGAQAAQLGVGEKLNLKGSHFSLGGMNPNYVTTQKTHYQGTQISEPAALNEEQKNQLRNNHFVLGHQDALQQSVNRTTFTQKPLQPNLQNEQDVQKAKMRSHHHDFAESTQKMMQTKYNEHYQRPPSNFQTQENLMDKVVALRTSNIVLGQEQLPMKTVQQGDYSKKEGSTQASTKPAFQQTHFYLGNAKRDYKTMNEEYFYEQKVEANPFAEENRANLRATHFILGKDGQGYQSEQNAHYRPYSECKQIYPSHTKFLQASHFSIGDARFANQKNQTQYNAEMKNPGVQQSGSARNQQQDRGSNFVIGNDNKGFVSEFQGKYGNPNGGPQKLNERLLKDLRSSHFGFNDVERNNYQTTKQAGEIKQQGQINQLDPHLSANLRSHHFQLGQTNGQQISATHDVHRQLDGKANVLNEKQAKNLRTHHFNFS